MEIPYEVTPRRDTGLFNAKLGIWLFLASEVMLFGGLFSSYVYLRVGVHTGVDNPWPWGLNVHENFVYLGFLNTLVLILSSVLVVFAWVSLKERSWRKFQIYMYGVVACAVIFMGVKSVEYYSKLKLHHGIKLVDDSVLEGRIVDNSDRIEFEGKKVSLNLSGGLPAFLSDIRAEKYPVFTVEGTEQKLKSVGQVKAWFLNAVRVARSEIAEERIRYRSEKVAFDKAEAFKQGSGKTPETVAQGLEKRHFKSAAVLVAESPFKMAANPRKLVMHNAKSLSYKDAVSVEGKLINDAVKFIVHKVDLQLVLPVNQRNSLAWKIVGEDGKKQFFDEQKVQYQHLLQYYKGKPIPERMMRGYILNLQKVHVGGHSEKGSVAAEHQAATAGEAEHGEAHHAGGKTHEETVVTVPRDQIKFMSAHSPRYGTYYAIYFTMTALHGLHVVGGALVLLFFVVFGKKLYLKDPEHLANRVEVGGLFWHFVDLIWIFLFPAMYLL